MKRSIALGLALLFLVVLVPTLFAQYNKDLVVQKMRSNGALVGHQYGVGAGAYASALCLVDLAANFKSSAIVRPGQQGRGDRSR
jgi:hypothetical protein